MNLDIILNNLLFSFQVLGGVLWTLRVLRVIRFRILVKFSIILLFIFYCNVGLIWVGFVRFHFVQILSVSFVSFSIWFIVFIVLYCILICIVLYNWFPFVWFCFCLIWFQSVSSVFFSIWIIVFCIVWCRVMYCIVLCLVSFGFWFGFILFHFLFFSLFVLRWLLYFVVNYSVMFWFCLILVG